MWCSPLKFEQEKIVAFITLGCAKNEVDTDKMRVRLINAGFKVVDDCSLADLVIVNTCSFLTSATQESLDTIFEVLNKQKRLSWDAKVLVAGCMPARYGADLGKELAEVAGFISVSDECHIVEKVSEILGCACTDKEPIFRMEDKAFAYVKISDGCDRFCSYCMIPYIRGRYKSYSLDSIMQEVKSLIDCGVLEIVFIGQDTGIWGSDFDEPDNLAHLLKVASTRFSNTWFRIMYTQPEGITDELLDLMCSTDNICSYLDIPLQHCNSKVLENMNRKGSFDTYIELVKHIREQVPDIMLRTTFMAGFPAESKEQFEELLDFASEASFDFAGVFPYSQEEGSKAATMSCQIDEDERISRAQELLDLIESIAFKRMEAHIGKTYTVLVEDYEQSYIDDAGLETDIDAGLEADIEFGAEAGTGLEALCRMQGQAPEVDSQIHVPINDKSDLPLGTFAQVEIIDSFCYELIGELVR